MLQNKPPITAHKLAKHNSNKIYGDASILSTNKTKRS